jgi:AbiJ N-terminal domain 4
VKDERLSFSERHGLVPPDAEITIRNEAPVELRGVMLRLAYDAGLSSDDLRSLVTRQLWTTPNADNWSAGNVSWEVDNLVYGCEWNDVYDIAEKIHAALASKVERHTFMPDPKDVRSAQAAFAEPLNLYFRKRGIGWQLVGGQIQARGGEAFEAVVASAQADAVASNLPTVSEEIHEALQGLSRRPKPDRTGAARHAIAALEAAARHVTGERKRTLGEILKARPDLFPAPLGVAVDKLWGFASDKLRHINEGVTVEAPEIDLVVSVACVAASYLMKKTPEP